MPPLFSISGKPTFLLGVNYWSKGGGPRMWERFDENLVRRELAQMRGMGLNTCRSFAFIPTFMPTPPKINPTALTRFQKFLDLCQVAGLSTIPTFLVGHMSGENYEFPGQQGRSPYTDAEVRQWEAALIREIASVGANHPAIIAYLATNEIPLWGGPSEPAIIAQWAQMLKQALYEKDAARPFGLGDGVMNLKGGQNGFHPPALRTTVDFLGPHTYYGDADPLRQAINAEYCLRSLTYLGLPVIFEEFGGSSCQFSEENQVLYYREVIHSSFSLGAAGALGWCYSDFDLIDEAPYTHHAFELGFGIVDAAGREKPVCDELRQISTLINSFDLSKLRPPKPNVAIIVPSYFNTTYPFSAEKRDRMHRTLLQAYLLCVGAGLEAELISEEADLSPYKLVILPATQKLLAPTWRALLAHAQAGNTVYWSYFAGDYHFHRSFWCQNFSELTGCKHNLRYGCFDLPDPLTQIDLNGFALKTKTEVGAPYPSAYLPIEPHKAQVLGRDQHQRPALVLNHVGNGQVIFLNHPWEYYFAEQANINRGNPAFGLYRLLGDLSKTSSPIQSSDPRIQIRLMTVDHDAPLLWAINHDWQTVNTTISSPAGVSIHGHTAQLSEGNTQLELKPKQVAVFRLGK